MTTIARAFLLEGILESKVMRSKVIRQPKKQLLYKSFNTKYEVPFYFWWILPLLKSYKVPNYYDQDCIQTASRALWKLHEKDYLDHGQRIKIRENFNVIIYYFCYCSHHCHYHYRCHFSLFLTLFEEKAF